MSIRDQANQLGKTMIFNIGANDLRECAFCADTMGHDERIVQLACNTIHYFHEQCYDDYAAFQERNNQRLACPFCREEVDKEKIVRKRLAEEKSAIPPTLEAFDVDLAKPGQAEQP